VGRLLARHFHERGDEVVVLTRHAQTGPWQNVVWTSTVLAPWAQELEGADVLINLTGRSVNCRYNHANRIAIMDSRVRTTEVLGRAVALCKRPPRVWLNASTATIYRHALDRDMDEYSGELGGDEPGVPETWRFSIDVARNWEKSFFDSPTPFTRKVALRSAMTMGPERGNVFDVLLRLVRLGLGGVAGSGEQYVSWIHEEDFVRAIDFLIEHEELDGAINVSSPCPIPNRDFMRDLRDAWGAQFGIDATNWMLEMGALVLRTETELILKSRRVVPRRLEEAGFEFEFAEWPLAAEDLVRRWRIARRIHF
jgi:uncharacterized protein (TIGR01777 family)